MVEKKNVCDLQSPLHNISLFLHNVITQAIGDVTKCMLNTLKFLYVYSIM